LIQGRYVLIGSSSISLGDRVSTPLAPLTAGLMVHAAAMSGLLDLKEGTLSLPRDATFILFGFCSLFFALAAWVVGRYGALTSTALHIGIGVLWLGFAYQLVIHQYEFSVVAPLVGVLTLLVTLVPLEWWLSQAQSRNLRHTLDALTRSGKFEVLVPQAQRVTVMVADMADYTRQTSHIPLPQMVELTKDFLDCITQPVLAYGGTLDKYTGDGLLAFWGAPLPCENSADMAIDAALQILKDFAALNQRRQAHGLMPIGMRIGIESGEAVVGEMGTRFRTAYTAIGECVNHASRIEAAAAKFGLSLLIGPATAELTQKHNLVRAGSLTIRGTDAAIDVYTCVTP
jgi:adenylate cyclase